jgi:hypothetical protein
MSQNVTLSAKISAAQSRRAGIDLALPHAVYTSVQMLEIHPQSDTSRPTPPGLVQRISRNGLER